MNEKVVIQLNDSNYNHLVRDGDLSLGILCKRQQG